MSIYVFIYVDHLSHLDMYIVMSIYVHTSPHLVDLTTNTAAASMLTTATHAASLLHFNQLFNYVNHINGFTLMPHETKYFVLAFLPTNKCMLYWLKICCTENDYR